MPKPSGPMMAVVQRQAALAAAQCPPASRLPEAEAAELPIHVARSGTGPAVTGPAVLVVHGGVQGGIGGGPASSARQMELAQCGSQFVDGFMREARSASRRSPGRGDAADGRNGYG